MCFERLDIWLGGYIGKVKQILKSETIGGALVLLLIDTIPKVEFGDEDIDIFTVHAYSSL